ncbi:hypothetical protein [Cryobacterium soli]|uniref:hypothetical protein n=1 Tax=Cryobacterium soli TaxID=2220095 RepID=UPI000E733DFE|nr:hypothetical protein [Cryobacterium soli]
MTRRVQSSSAERATAGNARERLALAQGRAVLSTRGGPRSADEVGYSVYLGVLTVLVVAVPLLRALVLGAADAESLAVLVSPEAPSGLAAGAVGLAGLALLVGPIRGPVLPSPFAVEFLVGSALARRVTLLRPFLVSAVVLAGLAVLAASVVSAALMVGGLLPAGPDALAGAGLTVLGCAASAVSLCVAWLAGQSLPRRWTMPLGAAFVAAGAVGVSPLRPGLAPANIPGGSVPVVLGTLVLALLCLPLIPRLLDRLRAADLMRQARRWQSIGTLLQTGDVAGAAGVLRTPPARGRHDRIALSGPLPVAVVQRDLGAARRFPVRMLAGSLAIAVAGWLQAGVWAAPPGGAWPPAVAAALAAYLGVGVWCDGLRSAAENAGPSSIYGRSGLTMIGCHAIVPALALLVLGTVGIAAAGVTAPADAALPDSALPWSALPWLTPPALAVPWWALVAVFITLLRVFDSLRGPLPIGLLLPVPTPVGDVSILNVIAWQADALILLLAGAAGLTVLAQQSGATAAAWLVVACGVVVALGMRRLRSLTT